jgi:N-acetylglucosaminyldiphosphoundecaprenol N-acetyl-beta-D-mannosaminyltransferase
MQQTGLEWAYRLGREPNRLWRRYIVNDMPVLGHLVISAMRGERDKGLPRTTDSLVAPT